MKKVAVVHEDGHVLRTYDIDFGNLDREPLLLRCLVCHQSC